MQLVGILLVVVGFFAGLAFTQELAEYERRLRRRRYQTMFRRGSSDVSAVQRIRVELFDQDNER